jgi:hypothetical protein
MENTGKWRAGFSELPKQALYRDKIGNVGFMVCDVSAKVIELRPQFGRCGSP